jgi:hypothetical protein
MLLQGHPDDKMCIAHFHMLYEQLLVAYGADDAEITAALKYGVKLRDQLSATSSPRTSGQASSSHGSGATEAGAESNSRPRPQVKTRALPTSAREWREHVNDVRTRANVLADESRELVNPDRVEEVVEWSALTDGEEQSALVSEAAFDCDFCDFQSSTYEEAAEHEKKCHPAAVAQRDMKQRKKDSLMEKVRYAAQNDGHTLRQKVRATFPRFFCRVTAVIQDRTGRQESRTRTGSLVLATETNALTF